MLEMVFPALETRKIWKITFKFEDIGDLEGFLRFNYETRSEIVENSSIIKKIVSTLPIIGEATILNQQEILIKLPPRFRQRIFRRDHIIRPGQIVYRPHIPAISIFAKQTNLYEPVEIIGEIKRGAKRTQKDMPPPKLMEIFNKLYELGSTIIIIAPGGRKEKHEEAEE